MYTNILMKKLVRLMESHMEEERCGLRKDRSCTDVRFAFQRLMDKRGEFKLQSFFCSPIITKSITQTVIITAERNNKGLM
jgi:hypothetical protein